MTEDENTGSAKGLESMASVGPTGDAGTSDDANWIGTTDNVRPADIHATGGSGDVPGTIGNATGPLATPSVPDGGQFAAPETVAQTWPPTGPGIGGLPTDTGLETGANTGSSAEVGPEGGANTEPGLEPLA